MIRFSCLARVTSGGPPGSAPVLGLAFALAVLLQTTGALARPQESPDKPPPFALEIRHQPLTEKIPEDGPEARGDRAWSQRARGFARSGQIDPAPTDEAIAAYEAALTADPDNLRIFAKLIEAVYFKGDYVARARDDKKVLFERQVELAARMVAVADRKAGVENPDTIDPEDRARLLRNVPGAIDAHLWASIGWGMWGMTHPRVSSLAKGVANKIRDHGRMMRMIDERFDHGAALRLLGRFHSETPRVILITGYIDREQALRMLREANRISKDDPKNLVFLADAILRHEPESMAEAVGLLCEASRFTPDPGQLIEHTRMVDQARSMLAGLETVCP